MNLEIAFGVPANQKVKAAEILYEAFQDKFEKIFGPKNRTIHLLSEHLSNNRTVTASHEGTVVGVGGLKFGGEEFIDITFWQLVQHLKVRIVNFLLLGWVFESAFEQKEILVDALAVAQEMRGRGVGSNLMKFIIDFAHSRDYERVKLFVIDTNEKAKKFYEKIGFKEEKTYNLFFPLNRILGFNKAFVMVYKI